MANQKLIVNTANCDIRNITEEILQCYEQITINSATVISGAKAQELISRYGNMTLNAASVYTAEEDVEVSFVNGKSEIAEGNAPSKKTLLVVNGSLLIRSCSPETLDNFASIFVNGKALCPKSLSSIFLAKASVNGKTAFYPDGAIILKNNTNIDRVFVLRAKDSLYWANSLLFLDTTVDSGAVRAKGTRFEADRVVIAESLVEKFIDLISEDTDIKIVPDGTQFVGDDVKLDDSLIKRYGSKLYIKGDLEVENGAEEALDQLEYVCVNGDVKIYKEYVEKFCAIKPEYKEMNVIERKEKKKYDKVVEDKIAVKIDKYVLEQCPNGVLVSDCAAVKIAQDIPSEMILERLSLSDCATVRCSPEQESAVGLIADDCASISTSGDGEEGVGGILKNAFGAIKDLANTKVINAAVYKF